MGKIVFFLCAISGVFLFQNCGELNSKDDLASIAVSSDAYTDIEEGYTLVGDMIVPNNWLANDENQETPVTQQAAKLDGKRLWPNGILPIHFESSVTSAKKSNFMIYCNRLTEIADIACITRTNEKDYISVKSITNGNSYSYVGLLGGAQAMAINQYDFDYETIAHELMHALSVTHEQNRSDRDQHINVLYQNVDSRYTALFNKEKTQRKTQYYDHNSITHYPSYAGSKNNRPTILRKDGSEIPQPKYLSQGDKDFLVDLYGPAGTKVLLSWDNKGPSVKYSIDARVNGQIIAPCINAGIVKSQTSFLFDGHCPTAKRDLATTPNLEFRVCAAENGIFGKEQSGCSQFAKVNDWHQIHFNFSKARLTWNNLGFNYKYSLDVKHNNKVTAPCISAKIVEGAEYHHYDGFCTSKGTFQAVNNTTKMRICGAKNGIFTKNNVTCSPYQSIKIFKATHLRFPGTLITWSFKGAKPGTVSLANYSMDLKVGNKVYKDCASKTDLAGNATELLFQGKCLTSGAQVDTSKSSVRICTHPFYGGSPKCSPYHKLGTAKEKHILL